VGTSISQKDVLSRKEAAALLSAMGYPITFRTLERLSSERKGPPYRRFMRRISYDRESLVAWARVQTTEYTG
jgi:hypothetical protein